MIIHQFENDLNQLGLQPHQHRVLLALPLIFVLTRDGVLSLSEQERIERFLRERLLFDSAEMNLVRAWLREPPPVSEASRGFTVLHALHAAPDVAAVGNQSLQIVFMECEAILRERKRRGEDADHRGGAELTKLSHRFGIDLGQQWQEIAPELLEEPQGQPAADRERSKESSSEPPMRRWRSALGVDGGGGSPESGGLV